MMFLKMFSPLQPNVSQLNIAVEIEEPVPFENDDLE